MIASDDRVGSHARRDDLGRAIRAAELRLELVPEHGPARRLEPSCPRAPRA